MGDAAATALLQQLRKLPANRVCVNCDAETKLGFGSVCSKYNTFVCDLCKTSHQAFSHRCKSVTMSHFSMDEVELIREENGGGNVAAKARWLANISREELDAIKPRANDPVDKYKRFVQLVYEDKKYFSEGGTGTAAAMPLRRGESNSSTGTTTATPSPARSVSRTPPVARNTPQQVSRSNSAAASGKPSANTQRVDEPNLLDFDSFEPTSSLSSSAAIANINNNSASAIPSMFGFMGVAPPQQQHMQMQPPQPAPITSSSASSNLFMAFSTAPQVPPHVPAMFTSTMNNNPAFGFQPQSQTGSTTYDPFATSISTMSNSNINNAYPMTMTAAASMPYPSSSSTSTFTIPPASQAKPSSLSQSSTLQQPATNKKPKDPFADLLSM
jgi:hypothetical protein